MALLWVNLFGIYFGGESALRMAVEVGDGARYWRVFGALLGLIEEIKAPVVAGAYEVI